MKRQQEGRGSCHPAPGVLLLLAPCSGLLHELKNALHILQLTALWSVSPCVVICTLRVSDLVFNSMAPGSGESLSLGDALQGSRWGF